MSECSMPGGLILMFMIFTPFYHDPLSLRGVLRVFMGSHLHLGYVPLWKSNVPDSGKSCVSGVMNTFPLSCLALHFSWNLVGLCFQINYVVHLYGQLIFNKESKNTQWRKDSLFNRWCWDNWIFKCNRMKLNPYYIPLTTIDLKWIKC